MEKKVSLSETTRAPLVILHKEGFSQRFVKKCPVAKQLFIKQNFGLYHDKKKRKKPRKTSLCDNNLIQQIAVWFLTSFCKKICMALLLKSKDSHCTIFSRLLVYDFNLKAFKLAKKTCFNSSHESKEVGFCQAI